MFKKKEEKPVGAADKIATAERMRQAALEEEEKKFGVRHESQMVPVTVIFVLAVALEFLMIDTSIVVGAAPGLGDILFGRGIPDFTGDGNMDRMIVVLVRALTLFLLTGFVPLVASVVTRVVGKRRITAYTACWAVMIALPLILYALKDILGPVFRDLLRG